MNELPKVTVAIPVLNEESHLDACLGSLVAGDFPVSDMEILVLDGGSCDASPEILERWSERHPEIRLVNNPRRLQAYALNIAMEMARGQYFVRLDAHSTYKSNYISTCIKYLEAGRAENVGGVQEHTGRSRLQRLISAALSSSFAMGPAAHRGSGEPSYAESVYLGAWKIETLRSTGGFNPALEVAEDFELNLRLARDGGKILVVPDLACEYTVRPDLPSLARQYFRYGLWKALILRQYPAALRPRHLAPAALTLALVVTAAITPLVWQPLALLALVYFAACAVAAVTVSRTRRDLASIATMFIFPVLHISYGFGFIRGFLSRRKLFTAMSR